MILKQNILFSTYECKFILSYNKLVTTNLITNDSKLIDYNKNTKWLFDKLKDFVERRTNIKIKKIKETIHFHKFIKGDLFDKHNDIREDCVYAVGVLLNDNFDGGDFKLYNSNEQILNKIIGNAYLFDIRIEHEITPILSGERYS